MEGTIDANDPSSRAAMTETLSALLDGLVKIDAMAAQLAAARTAAIESLRQWSDLIDSVCDDGSMSSRDLAFRSLRAEVACALRLPERTVESMFGEARVLMTALPETMTALGKGEISFRHAQVIIDNAGLLSGAHLEKFERLAVSAAATSTVATLKRQARTLRESLDPSSMPERLRQAADRREVTWSPGNDGRGILCLDLDVADGAAIYSRATDVALKMRDAERGSEHPRTLAQLRLDVMRDALMCGTFDALGGKLVRPDVFVTVPVLSLMGLTAEPGHLDGYGPIPAHVARELAAGAPSFMRLLVHPHTGAVLALDRDRYSLPSDLKNAVRARYSVCAMVGCNQLAERCDIDHTRDWAFGGKTELRNLAPLCRSHHTMKHHTPWKVTQDPGGSGALTWTSPLGRTYVTQPENRARAPELAPF